MIIGTDTSFYAENVDYDKMVEAGAEFTVIRAGQGSWIDNYFEKNRAAAKGKIPRGAYWFYDNRYEPQRQAELYKAALGDDLMESVIWCDYERQYHSDPAGWDDWTNFWGFVKYVEREFPTKTVGIYTGYFRKATKRRNARTFYFKNGRGESRVNQLCLCHIT